MVPAVQNEQDEAIDGEDDAGPHQQLSAAEVRRIYAGNDHSRESE